MNDEQQFRAAYDSRRITLDDDPSVCESCAQPLACRDHLRSCPAFSSEASFDPPSETTHRFLGWNRIDGYTSDGPRGVICARTIDALDAAREALLKACLSYERAIAERDAARAELARVRTYYDAETQAAREYKARAEKAEAAHTCDQRLGRNGCTHDSHGPPFNPDWDIVGWEKRP